MIQGTAKILDGESNGTGGGNMHVTSGAQLTIDGQAEISGGDASARGGNIYANSATTHVDMFGGTLQNGQTTGTSSGGNAFFYEATFDFYGGKKAIVPTRLARNVISAGTL